MWYGCLLEPSHSREKCYARLFCVLCRRQFLTICYVLLANGETPSQSITVALVVWHQAHRSQARAEVVVASGGSAWVRAAGVVVSGGVPAAGLARPVVSVWKWSTPGLRAWCPPPRRRLTLAAMWYHLQDQSWAWLAVQVAAILLTSEILVMALLSWLHLEASAEVVHLLDSSLVVLTSLPSVCFVLQRSLHSPKEDEVSWQDL